MNYTSSSYSFLLPSSQQDAPSSNIITLAKDLLVRTVRPRKPFSRHLRRESDSSSDLLVYKGSCVFFPIRSEKRAGLRVGGDVLLLSFHVFLPKRFERFPWNAKVGLIPGTRAGCPFGGSAAQRLDLYHRILPRTVRNAAGELR